MYKLYVDTLKPIYCLRLWGFYDCGTDCLKHLFHATCIQRE